MAADAAMDTTCPSPELGDSRKRPLDDGTDDGTSKRSHFSTNGKSSQDRESPSTLCSPLKDPSELKVRSTSHPILIFSYHHYNTIAPPPSSSKHPLREDKTGQGSINQPSQLASNYCVFHPKYPSVRCLTLALSRLLALIISQSNAPLFCASTAAAAAALPHRLLCYRCSRSVCRVPSHFFFSQQKIYITYQSSHRT